MESGYIQTIRDADFCNCSAGRRSREATTIAECERLYRQASEKGDVGYDADTETA